MSDYKIENEQVKVQALLFEDFCNQTVATLTGQGLTKAVAQAAVCGMCVGVATTSMGRTFVFNVASRVPDKL